LNRKIKIIIIMTAILFVTGIIGSVFILRPSENHIAEIVHDGEIIYTFDLSSTPDQSIIIKSKNGSSNTIKIENGEIFISSSECPDKTCVNMGKLKSDSMPVVCLPNRLIIRFREEQ